MEMSEQFPLEELQSTEFTRFAQGGHVYVDYTGGGQCPESVLSRIYKQLTTTVFGNPHSHNPTAKHTTALVEGVRARVADFVGAPTNEYEVIFTPNASGALKIVGESYPWDENTVLLLARDNHNSVLGMREFAKRAGATVQYWELDEELRLENRLEELIIPHTKNGKHVVLAFPAQSNFSGVIHPLAYVKKARELGAHVVLDTAAYIPSHPFDAGQVGPDAFCISFYKVLGYPTGIGALIIRKEFLQRLRKPWFAGGTVRGVSLDGHVLERGHERFEDGTVNYACIPHLAFVFDFIEHIGGVEKIEQHVHACTEKALSGLQQLPNVQIYGPQTMRGRGGTIAFNVLDENGVTIHYERVEEHAAQHGVSLRGGCFCNPGTGSAAFEIDGEKMQYYLEQLQTHGKSEAGVPGAIRISFGIGNTQEDIEKTLECIASIPRK